MVESLLQEAWVLQLRDDILEQLDVTQMLSDKQVKAEIEHKVFQLSKQRRLTSNEMKEVVGRIFHSLRGMDILQPLLEDPAITEIMVNSECDIFIEKEGAVSAYPYGFENREKLENVIQTIVGKVNRVVNEFSPIVDARLEDGSRVNVVMPPIALNGPALTIRKFPDQPLTMEDLIDKQAISEEAAALLKQLVKARYNIFIGGGTGSGKTTFLNALSQWIPADERVITIEDSAELQLRTIPNLVRLETRNANSEGKGQITIRDLIRSSLRMRPNRIVVGEVRGAEALDMLQAMNTGHDGSLSTGHANSNADMISRLETMVLSGAELPITVVRKQISSAIDILIHLSRLRDRTRRVMEISEIVGIHDGEVVLNPLFQFEEQDEDSTGRVIGQLRRTTHSIHHQMKAKLAGINLESERGGDHS